MWLLSSIFKIKVNIFAIIKKIAENPIMISLLYK